MPHQARGPAGVHDPLHETVGLAPFLVIGWISALSGSVFVWSGFPDYQSNTPPPPVGERAPTVEETLGSTRTLLFASPWRLPIKGFAIGGGQHIPKLLAPTGFEVDRAKFDHELADSHTLAP